MVREQEDLAPNYLQSDLEKFQLLYDKELVKAYSQLVKAMTVIFSGSLDPILNKVDYRKLASKYYSNRTSQESLSPERMKLMK